MMGFHKPDFEPHTPKITKSHPGEIEQKLTSDQSNFTSSVLFDRELVDGIGKSLERSKDGFRHYEMKRGKRCVT